MLKTAVIGKTANGTTQLSRLMVMSGDRIILVDATTGQPPKKVTTKMVNKDLHIFAEGATEPSVILNDYASFSQSIDISGIDASGAYVNYGAAEAGSMELGAVGTTTAAASAPIMSTSAWWGVGILAVAGGVAVAAGGGGDSATATTPITPTVTDTTDPIAPVIAVVAIDNIINASENTNLVISGTGEVGATVTLAVANQTAVVDSAGNWSITVADAAATFGQGAETLSVTQEDIAGNVSVAGTRAISVDTVAPTLLSIVDDETAVIANIAGGDILYTFTFDEAVTGFTIGDITIAATEGTAQTFTPVSSTVYTLGVTPLNGYEGNMTISVDNVSYTDIAGNIGSVDIASTQVVDMLAPVFMSAVAHSGNESIVLTYSELLETVNMANPASFTVTVDAVSVAVASVGMLNDQVTLTLATGFNTNAVVAVTYADVTSDSTPAIQDVSGNDAASLPWQYLTAVI